MRLTVVIGLVAAALLVQGATQASAAADATFSCTVYGGSFVLDDDDFRAMSEQKKMTRAKFASLPAASRARAGVCQTRMVSRLLREGKTTSCDAVHYPNVVIAYFGHAEYPMVAKWQDQQTGTEANCPP